MRSSWSEYCWLYVWEEDRCCVLTATEGFIAEAVKNLVIRLKFTELRSLRPLLLIECLSFCGFGFEERYRSLGTELLISFDECCTSDLQSAILT
jgi:signal transduction protein with GAF and PtsI domain